MFYKVKWFEPQWDDTVLDDNTTPVEQEKHSGPPLTPNSLIVVFYDYETDDDDDITTENRDWDRRVQKVSVDISTHRPIEQ